MELLEKSEKATHRDIDAKFEELYDRFSVKTFKLKDLTIETEPNDNHSSNDQHKNNKCLFQITTDNTEYTASERFVKSIAKQKGLSPDIFNLFSYKEVFSRFANNDPDYEFKVSIDKDNNQLLGAIPENKKILEVDKVLDIIRKDKRLSNIEYSYGFLSADLNCNDSFEVLNDSTYEKSFNFNYCIDGLVVPHFSLSLLRQVCSNGAQITVKEYQTDAIISDNKGEHLKRILQSFNNESGFDKLFKRLNIATVTPCSLDELSKFENFLSRNCHSKSDSNQLISILEDYAGQPKRKHGVSNLNTIPEMMRKTTKCDLNVADLFNIGTELLTHHTSVVKKSDLFNTNLAKLITNPFDFEDVEKNIKKIRYLYLTNFTEAPVINEITKEDIYSPYSYDYDENDFCRI